MLKDWTSTTFGLLIAYLLPGLGGLLCLLPFLDSIKKRAFPGVTLEFGGPLLTLLIAAGIAIGLELSVFRWLAFEKVICRQWHLPAGALKELATSSKLEAFRAAVEEYYRYHQFWGALALILPALVIQLRHSYTSSASPALTAILVLALEIPTVAAAIGAFRNYTSAVHAILEQQNAKGEPHA